MSSAQNSLFVYILWTIHAFLIFFKILFSLLYMCFFSVCGSQTLNQFDLTSQYDHPSSTARSFLSKLIILLLSLTQLMEASVHAMVHAVMRNVWQIYTEPVFCVRALAHVYIYKNMKGFPADSRKLTGMRNPWAALHFDWQHLISRHRRGARGHAEYVEETKLAKSEEDDFHPGVACARRIITAPFAAAAGPADMNYGAAGY